MNVKIGICIPTAGFIRAQTFYSLYSLFSMLIRKKLWPEAKDQSFQLYMQQGSVIAANREDMVKRAMEEDCTHILFIDDDMNFKPRAFELMARRRQPIVGCNYRRRLPPAEFTALHLDEPRGERGWVQTTAESTGLEPIDYMGFGLCLIDMDVFRKLEKPWFQGTYKNGNYGTEDMPFFIAARNAGFTAYVDQDASKYVAHVGVCEYAWHTEYPEAPTVVERGEVNGTQS